MAIESNPSRISRICSVEGDHFEQAADSIKALTIDPLKNTIYYFFPCLGTLFNTHCELRPDDRLLRQDVKVESIGSCQAQVESLLKAARIWRNVDLYGSHNYSCSSYGGYCSITSPIISIPFSYFTKQAEPLFESAVIAKSMDTSQPTFQTTLAALSCENPSSPEERKEQEVAPNVESKEVPSAIAKPEDPEAAWRFTTDESLFFIAREVENLKSNNPFIRIVTKVIYAAALFFLWQLSLPIALGSIFMTAAVSFHVIAERVLRSHLDVDAVKLLEDYFFDFDYGLNKTEEEIREMAKTSAYEAGKSAIKKLISRNRDRREENDLCRLYITAEGNNLIDLINPFLTARLNLLEENRKNGQNPH